MIECITLLDRLKNFNSFLNRIFTLSPKRTTLILLFVCVLIDFVPIFQYSAFEYDFVYITNQGRLEKYSAYFIKASDIASSQLGTIITVVIFIIRDGISLAFSISLNIICFVHMKRHVSKKLTLTNINFNIGNTPNVINLPQTSYQANELAQERIRIYQKNIFQMTITLLTISTIVRITTLTCGIYWLFRNDFFAIIIGMMADISIASNAMLPFFVHLKFNNKYRKILFSIVKRRVYEQRGLQTSGENLVQTLYSNSIVRERVIA